MTNFPNQLRMNFFAPPPPPSTPTPKKCLLLQISKLSCNNLGKGSKKASKKSLQRKVLAKEKYLVIALVGTIFGFPYLV